MLGKQGNGGCADQADFYDVRANGRYRKVGLLPALIWVLSKTVVFRRVMRTRRGRLEDIFSVANLKVRLQSMGVFMQNLVSALAAASSYLVSRTDAFTEDDDIAILEDIGATLQAATAEEKRAVIAAFVDIGRTDLVDGLGIE